MRKRWGVRVIAILMLIIGMLLFLLGLAPAVVMAVRGAGGFEKYLAIPTLVFGCLAAFPLLVVGLVLLTLGRVADNFATASQPVPERRAVPAAAVIAVAPQASPGPGAETTPVAVVALDVEAAHVAEEKPSAVAPVAAGALAAVAAEEWAGAEPEVVPAGETLEEVAAPAAVAAAAVAETAGPEPAVEEAEAAPAAEQAEPTGEAPAAATAVGVETRSPQDEVSALQAQLAALQAQLNELDGASFDVESLPAPVEDEGPAPGATETVKLPGADEAARVAAEMAALNKGSKFEATQEQ